ncbi:hypothetical protein IQ268_11625 [Oculatella sp. LEGE 06141]|uniref:hypothetical protein n=1 Tax=Oculatella sp. LEGE 06141 TaxID=1828648 RepID=UPI0018815935|nr:hypothetical protein [Oculatella sp. LEGE 06141]MBE9179211.1 hypothetical protein [Oculatella sp. LEGE 06141]
MSRQSQSSRSLYRRWGWVLPWLVLLAPAAAHKVQTSGDIGGTQHIEPNDTPRAGEPSLTWFALTRQGGEVLPLEACDCSLAVYKQPYTEQDAPILESALEPISTEGYQNIPSAEITFPEVGAYEVVLRGQPRAEGDFQPFELQFDVTVAVGTSRSPEAGAIAPASAPDANSPVAIPSTVHPLMTWQPWVVGLAVIGVAGLGILAWQVKGKRQP